MTDEQRLAEIRARLEAATPGPWDVDIASDCCVGPAARLASEDPIVTVWGQDAGHDERDADFIAHSRDDIPFLLERLVAAEAELADKQAMLDCCAETMTKYIFLSIKYQDSARRARRAWRARVELCDKFAAQNREAVTLAERQRHVIRWLVHLANGVGKGGNTLTQDEWTEAWKVAQSLLDEGVAL